MPRSILLLLALYSSLAVFRPSCSVNGVMVFVTMQMASEPRVAWIAEQLAGLGLDATTVPSSLRLATGNRCIARFSLDGQVCTSLGPVAPQRLSISVPLSHS